MFYRVAEFHRAFGAYISTEPVLPDSDIRTLRISLIREELNEYHAAFADNNRIEMADALADLLYVLAGTAVAYGITPDTMIESPYDIGLSSRPRPLDANFPTRLSHSFEYYLAAEDADNLDEIRKTIYDMMGEIFIIACQSGIPINAVFAEVHRSNMSKLDENGQPILRADGKILKTSPLFSPPDIAGVLAQYYV